MSENGPHVEHVFNLSTALLQDSFEPLIMLCLEAFAKPTLNLSQLEACLELKSLRSIEPGLALLSSRT